MNRRGKQVSRVLYWYRTPPDVKVGREPFDAAVRQALEAQNPHVKFDWRQILETPIPSADADKWRERRRAERSERAARQALNQQDEVAADAPPPAVKHVIEAATAEAPAIAMEVASIEPIEITSEAVSPAVAAVPVADPIATGPSRRKRRRRRGGRSRPEPGPAAGPTESPAAEPPGDEHATDTDE